MSLITYTIPGVPLLDQLKEASNPTYDCVFESNAALATAYLHKPFTGTQIKAMDSDYGPGYTGGASEAKLVDTMARLGIKMTRIQQPTQQALLDALHWQIERYHRACIITMPSQWNSAVTNAGKNWNPRTYRGPTHVGLACGTGPNGAIRVMNPWGGFWHDGSGAYWMARLLEGEIWVGELIAEGEGGKPMATKVPDGWRDDGTTLTAPNGVAVVQGFRDWVLTHDWDAHNQPIAAERVMASSVEWFDDKMGPGSRQDFLRASLGWTAKLGVFDIPVGRDLGALENYLAASQAQSQKQYGEIQSLRGQIATLQQQLAQALANAGDPNATALVKALRVALAA